MNELTTGAIIDTMFDLREQRRILAKQDKELADSYKSLEAQLLERLRQDDNIQAKSALATATVTETTVPSVKDWEAFETYIIDNRALYLLQRRPAAAAFKELLTMGEVVPGVEPLVTHTIALRKN